MNQLPAQPAPVPASAQPAPAPPAPVFLHNIPSIQQKNPRVPAMLGTIDLNHTIQAGDTLDYQQVKHAQDTALALKGLHDMS